MLIRWIKQSKKKIEFPEGYGHGLLFGIATGEQLDLYGKWSNLPRESWWIFKEPDASYKNRLTEHELRKTFG